MRRYRKWVLTLGLMAAAPGISVAGPFSLFNRDAAPSSTATASNRNQQVAERIAAALRQEDMSRYNIDIEFKNGVATLNGQISDVKQKARVTQIVSRVPGVEKIDNRLALLNQNSLGTQSPARRSPIVLAGTEEGREADSGIQTGAFETPVPLPRPTTAAEFTSKLNNQQMAERIAATLGKSDFKGYDIEIRFSNGTAILGGSVGTPQHRARAEQVVAGIPGVQAVDNRLMVAGQPAQMAAGFPAAAYGQTAQGAIHPAAFQPNGAVPPGPPQPGMTPPNGMAMPMHPGMGMPAPPSYGQMGQSASYAAYDTPHLPEHAWPSYANYPNYAQVTYPTEYSASAWPYIGPFYPYPQIPLGWRQAQLEWDDGHWQLNFRPRSDRWWWFLDPKNW